MSNPDRGRESNVGERVVQPVKRLFCRNCRCETNHESRASSVRYFREGTDDPEDPGFWEELRYSFWVCRGCDTATLEEAYTFSGYSKEGGEQLYDYEYFPPGSPGHVKAKHFRRLPDKLGRIYKEIVEAHNGGLYLLSAAGLRALIEGICSDKGISGRNLEERIDGMAAHLPKNIVDNLHSFRFIGNPALHELAVPKGDDLRLAIEVSEDILNFLYELDYKASLLGKSQAKAARKGGQAKQT